MTRLRQLHLLSGLLTGSSCPNCPPTSRTRPWSTRREREGRGRRGRLAGAGRRGSTGGDIVELYACRRFCTGLLRCVCGCVTAGGECRSRLLFTCRYLSQAAFHLATSPPPSPAMSRLAKRHPDLLVSLPRFPLPPPATDYPSPELQLQPRLLVHRSRA